MRDGIVEKADQRAHQPALGLPFFTEKEQVVPGEDGEVDFGKDRILIADDAGEEILAGLQHSQEIITNLLLDGFRYPSARPQLLERGGSHPSRHVPMVSAGWKITVALVSL
jgi:hypothetical protein